MGNGAILAQTQRLILRRYQQEDLQDLWEYLSDADTLAYEPYRPMTLEEAGESLKWRMGTQEMVAVELADARKMIGNVYLGKRDFEALEIGYVFNRAYWGKGYAAESCRALISQAFSQGTHRIYGECDPDNQRSWRLLEALGFRREAHLKQNVYFWKDGDGRSGRTPMSMRSFAQTGKPARGPAQAGKGSDYPKGYDEIRAAPVSGKRVEEAPGIGRLLSQKGATCYDCR